MHLLRQLMPYLPFLLGLLIAIIHYLGEMLDERLPKSVQYASFSSGIAISYVFLQLLPELKEGTQHFGNYAFVFALGGFVTFHIVQKWVYQHSKSPDELVFEFRSIHSIFLFIYHFVIGIVLSYLARQHIVQAILFFVPVLLHTVFSSLSLKELHEDVLDQPWIRFGIAGSILPGIAVPFLLPVTPAIFHILLGIITGMLLYISIHDSMPEQSKGSPAIFLAGIVLYGMVVIYIWQLI